MYIYTRKVRSNLAALISFSFSSCYYNCFVTVCICAISVLSCYYFSPLILSGKFVGGFLLINSVFVSNDLLTMLPFYWLCYMISMCQQLFQFQVVPCFLYSSRFGLLIIILRVLVSFPTFVYTFRCSLYKKYALNLYKAVFVLEACYRGQLVASGSSWSVYGPILTYHKACFIIFLVLAFIVVLDFHYLL